MPTEDNTTSLLNCKQASEVIGCTVSAINKWKIIGYLPVADRYRPRTGGPVGFLFRREDVLSVYDKIKDGARTAICADDDPAELLTPKEAGDLVRRCPDTIKLWRRTGKIEIAGYYKPPKNGHRGHLYRASDVIAIANEIEQERIQERLCKKISAVDLSYLAGLFDGEGCFTATIRRRPWPSCAFRACIAMTTFEILKWVREVTGLGYLHNKNVRNPVHKPCYGWDTSGKESAAFASAVLPYLRLKTRQAQIIIELHSLFVQIKDGAARTEVSVPLVEELHRLNKRGV